MGHLLLIQQKGTFSLHCTFVTTQALTVNTVEVTQIARGLPTVQKSNKERCVEKQRRAEVASSDTVYCRNCTQETHCAKTQQHEATEPIPPEHAGAHTHIHRAFKVTGRKNPDERHAARKACPTLSVQLPTPTYITAANPAPAPAPASKHAYKQMKRTQSVFVNTHRCRVVTHL